QTISGATSTSAFNNVTLSGTGGVSFASGNNASTSALTINSGETLTAPSLLTIGGNYTNSGTFTANSGTVYASSSVPQTFSGTMTGTTGAFNNLTILNNSGTNPDTNPAIIFANNASTTATFTATLASTTIRFPASATSTFVNFTLNGQAANSRVWLRSSTAGTPWGLIVTGTQSVSYADVQDSYACDGSTITASNGTNNNSGNNSCWTFAASSVATVTSAANQVFAVSQASTPISQLTITNVSGSAITAANGLRIAIATSTVNMLWDPAFTKAVFGGSASTTRVASAIVGYEGGNSVATITVASDFANGEQLTVSGLNFANFGAAVASSTAIQLFLDGINDQSANAQNTAQYVAITGAQTVANATAGQESNKLANAQPDTTVSNASLFSFRLTPSSENASTTQIVVNLSSVSGYACSNIANLNLYVDYNSNNSVDAGETATGTAACSISGSTGTFTFTTKLATSTARDFVVQADVSGNNFGNTMTLALSAANVTTRGQTSNQPITVTGTVTNATHSQQSTTGGGASAAGSVSPSEVPTFGATTQSGGGATEGGQGGTVNGTGGATNQGGGSPVDLAPLFKPFAGIQLPWNFASALFGFGRFFGL
ncbi:hypothetical protein KGQ34_04380, partial [Patescibacteria group bacterium]|nr:hypothetical protein [Patescibacteria group bacterium]